jgi:diguanylate cyclase (GGDEF)-like protein
MSDYLWEIPHDLRTRIATAVRDQQVALTEDVSAALTNVPGSDPKGSREFSGIVVSLFASATESGGLDNRRGVLHDFCQAASSMPPRQIVHSVHRAERILLDEIALDESLGATSESWPMVAHSIRTAAFEILAAYNEREGGRTSVRDTLTTLISSQVFRLALEQETERANRYEHGMSMLLFDVDNLGEVNRRQGFGAGDRLLERLGILARRFFRNHDWVARHGEDAIAVLLPETPLDQAAVLASRFREMVQQRLVLMDHKTDSAVRVTVSAAAVGTDLVTSEVDAGYVIAEAEAAVLRAKLDGGNRTERIALLPTSVTILGAATLLDTSPREVVKLMRGGLLKAARRGRHFHIDRAHIEEFKRTRERDA